MSSNARKMLPAEVLTHPAVVALIERGAPTGSITPEEVRQASGDAAAVEPRHLKALLAHLSALGISRQIPVSTRAVAAASSRKDRDGEGSGHEDGGRGHGQDRCGAGRRPPRRKKAAPAKRAAAPARSRAGAPQAGEEVVVEVVVGRP